MSAIHEDLRREHRIRAGSERSFGLVIAAFLMIVGLAPLRHGHDIRAWALVGAAALAALAAVRPGLLAPLNVAWTRVGLLIARVTQPIVVGVVFFAAVLPLGLVMRLFGRTPLRLVRQRDVATYWLSRPPAVGSMTRQF